MPILDGFGALTLFLVITGCIVGIIGVIIVWAMVSRFKYNEDDDGGLPRIIYFVGYLLRFFGFALTGIGSFLFIFGTLTGMIE